MANVRIVDLYDLSHTVAADHLAKYTYPWEVLADVKDIILDIGSKLDLELYEKRGEDIWISKSAKVYPNNYIAGPCIIGHNTEVRPGAFIRGNALVGENCVVGNSTELKNVILFDKVQVPHYNYVGDSILGYKAHLGASAITSNVKSDKTNVSILIENERYNTNLRKFGAILGDCVEVGCGTVLNPGSVVGKNTNIYPLSSVRGYVAENSIYKNRDNVVRKN